MSETDMTDYAELREEKAATPHNELIAQLLDSRVPKSEREHAAAREIERLRAEVERWKGQHMRDSAELRRLCQHRDEYKARAERLAEALRELVAVFSESGMYDEEVFAHARAALGREDET